MSMLTDHLDAKYAFPTQCVLKRAVGYLLNSIPPGVAISARTIF